MQTATPAVSAAQSDYEIAQEQLQRFWFACSNGHEDYVFRNRRNYRYFHGDGGHWSDDDRDYMESVTGRKCFEINLTKQAVLTAVGEQISTRADISFKAKRGNASADTAKILSKLAKHFLDQNNFHVLETDMWESGLISERGYIDIRMVYDGNLHGEIKMCTVDPVTVIPDVFATEYDPREWPGFMRFMWLTLDEIEGMYGKAARARAEQDWTNYNDRPFTDDFPVNNRSDSNYGFGTSPGGYYQWWSKDAGELRLRVIERQHYKRSMALHYVDMQSGDTKLVPETLSLQEARVYAANNRLLLQKMEGRRLMWTVTTATTVLHNDWSPYESPTIIPFFYLFNKGRTGCMVSDAISPQDLLNKSVSALTHYMTSLSNSGWVVAKDSLTNMTTHDLSKVGMKTGLVIEYDPKVSTNGPQKIQPNSFPAGMDRLAERGEAWIKAATGMSDAEQGLHSAEVSGVAIGMKQFQSKLQLAKPLSNLQFTRTLVGRKLLELIQQFITTERIYKIVGKDSYGRPEEEELVVNQVDPSGAVLNDITVGEYDVEVSEQPMAATYEESQFMQLAKMRGEMGVAIPDDEIVRRSNLSNKNELADRLANPQDNGVADANLKLLLQKIKDLEASEQLKQAQAKKALSATTLDNVETIYSGLQAAQVAATVVGAVPAADEIIKSAGFKDQNQAPLMPEPVYPAEAAVTQQPPQENTSPMFPAKPDGPGEGMMTGIETQRADGVLQQ